MKFRFRDKFKKQKIRNLKLIKINNKKNTKILSQKIPIKKQKFYKIFKKYKL